LRKGLIIKEIVCNIDGLVKSPSIPQSGRVGVEPFEFTSNGGGGEALPRRVKRRGATLYEVVNIDSQRRLIDRVYE